jgi:hypothetical protein
MLFNRLLNNYIKQNLKFFSSIYLIILGICWIILHIITRFVIERPSYNLFDLKQILTYKLLLIFTGFVILHLLIIIQSLYLLFLKNRFTNTNSLLYKLAKKVSGIVNIIYWNPIQYIHDTIAPHIPGSARFFSYIDSLWKNKNSVFFYRLLFIMDALPKLIVASIFLLEIVYYGQIKYFLISLSLLCIPISFSIFLKFFTSCGERNKPKFKDFFSLIEGINPILNDQNQPFTDDIHYVKAYYKVYKFEVKDEYAGKIDGDYAADMLILTERMSRWGREMKEDLAKISPYISLVTSVIYFVGGFYRIIVIVI